MIFMTLFDSIQFKYALQWVSAFMFDVFTLFNVNTPVCILSRNNSGYKSIYHAHKDVR